MKRFSKDNNNDEWTISHINHVNFSDEVEAQNKTFEEFLKENFPKNDNDKKKE